MKYSTSIIAAGCGMVSTVASHGFLTSPQPRLAGDAMKAACGRQVFNNQASDSYGNIQGELQVAASQPDYDEEACNIWLCKGFKFADNTANVQTWTAGQTVEFKFDVRAPHTGYANVSIVNTATNTIIGDQLLVYSDFGDNSKTIPTNETSFSVTIPSDLGDTCSIAGACVLQHYWNAESIDQTYESCIDFTVGGSGSSSSAVASSSSPAEVALSTSPAVPTTSNAIATPISSAASTSSVISLTTSKVAAVTPSSSTVPTTLQTFVLTPTTAAPTKGPSATAPAGNNNAVQMPAGTKLNDLLSWITSFFTTHGDGDYTGSTVA